MELSTALERLPARARIPTLAKRSFFHAWRSGGQLIIENAVGTTRSINTLYWETVRQRRRSLGFDKNTTSEYTDPKWNLPPPTDRIFAPYVAAVMKYLGA